MLLGSECDPVAGYAGVNRPGAASARRITHDSEWVGCGEFWVARGIGWRHFTMDIIYIMRTIRYGRDRT